MLKCTYRPKKLMFTVNSSACFAALLVAWSFGRFVARRFPCSVRCVVSTSGVLGKALCVIRYYPLCFGKLGRRQLQLRYVGDE